METPPLWRLPDTSVLLHRYMDAPRLVNVYDWFETWAAVVERGREEEREGDRDGGTEREKGDASGRGRGNIGGREEAGEDREEDEEVWQTELQARFIRALHELDYMGFVKHTGRKRDCIIRTVYDVLD
jgi:origin recognition complex subunit 3